MDSGERVHSAHTTLPPLPPLPPPVTRFFLHSFPLSVPPSSLSQSAPPSLSHSLPLSVTPSLYQAVPPSLNNSLSLSQSLNPSLSQSLPLSITPPLSLSHSLLSQSLPLSVTPSLSYSLSLSIPFQTSSWAPPGVSPEQHTHQPSSHLLHAFFFIISSLFLEPVYSSLEKKVYSSSHCYNNVQRDI